VPRSGWRRLPSGDGGRLDGGYRNVETVTWRDAFPAGTVTKKGGCAAALLLLNDTDKPIDRATPLRETVRVALFPPFT